MTEVPPFHQRVYAVARDIPVGATLTYGDVALEAGAPGAARAVGQALGRNPFAIVVPCHRVTAAGGKVGGFSATGGVETKLRILELEGTVVPNGRAAPGAWDVVTAVEQLRAADAGLRRLIDRVGPCTLATQRTASVFSALLEAIVFQQLSGKAAATIHGRVCALLPALAHGSPGRGPAWPPRRRAPRRGPVAGEVARRARPRPTHGRREPADPARAAPHGRRGGRRRAHAGAGSRPLDRGDVPRVPPRTPGRARTRRSRDPQGVPARVPPPGHPVARRRWPREANGGGRTGPSRVGTSGAPRSSRRANAPRAVSPRRAPAP